MKISEHPRFKLMTDRQMEAWRLLNDPSFRYYLLYGGSRSGKTFLLCKAMAARAIKAPESNHVIFRQKFNHIKSSVWYGTFPKMMKICFPEVSFHQNKSDWFIEFPNDSKIWFAGLDDKERTEKILGNEYSTMYLNEASQISYSSYGMAKTRLAEKSAVRPVFYIDCNPPAKTHWLYQLFFKGVQPDSKERLSNFKSHTNLLMNPIDNAMNLGEGYIEEELKSLPARQRLRFLEGLFLDEIEGALWSVDMLDRNRIIPLDMPEMEAIVVAVDPAVTSTDTSDEHGIVICGRGVDKHGYVLADRTLKGKPKVWAQAAINAYYEFEANCIVVETNQGGDMVIETIKAIDRDWETNHNTMLI